jgi:subtilisin family serine protease
VKAVGGDSYTIKEKIMQHKTKFSQGSPWRVTAGFVLLAIVTLMLAGVVFATEGTDPAGSSLLPVPGLAENSFVPGEVLVKLEPGLAVETEVAVRSQVGATYLYHLYQSDVQLWQIPTGEEQATIAALNKLDGVDYAEPNYLVSVADTIPNDPEFYRQWAHPIMTSPAGWEYTVGSSGVVIAIMDTGIDLGHPDLAGKLVPGYDFYENDGAPWDEHGHGTHAAGIAGALTNNGVGVAGMDWQARLMPVRVLGEDGVGSLSQVTSGINFAYTNGAEVINMSLGGTGSSQTMQNAVTAATNNGSLVVASMGNERDNGNPVIYPAAYDDVLAVSATDRNDNYAFYSSHGSYNDLAAPGGEMSTWQDSDGIYSTMPTYEVFLTRSPYQFLNNYDYLFGTSMSAPYVSGLAALILSASPAMSPGEVELLMKNTAVDLGPAGWDEDFGFGRINVSRALVQVAVPAAPVLDEIENQDGDGSFTVSWNAVANGNNYVLQTDTTPTFTSPTQVYSGPGTSTVVDNAAPGWHYFRVLAQGPGGDSPWSNTRSVVVVPDAPVLNPINNPGGDDAYSVEWQAADAASGYILEEDDNAGFNSPQVRYMGHDTAYQVTGQAGGTWYYRVRGYNEAGNGDFSNTRSTTVDPAVLPAPALSPISSTGAYSYTVDWSAVVSATGYILEESTDPFFVNTSVVYNGTDTSYAVTQSAGGTWHYRVRADSPAGMSPWSNAESTTITVIVYLPVMLRP